MKYTDKDKSKVFEIIEDIISWTGNTQNIEEYLDDLMLGYIEVGAKRSMVMDDYLHDIVYFISTLKRGFSDIGKIITFNESDENKRQ